MGESVDPSFIAPIALAMLVIGTARLEIRNPGSARAHWSWLTHGRARAAGAAAALLLSVAGRGLAGVAAIAWAVLAGLLVAHIADLGGEPVAPSVAERGEGDACVPREIVLLDERNDGRRTVIGRLRFRECPKCRTGRILDIWVDEAWRRQGLGHELIDTLLDRHPGHRWSTTLKTRRGRVFFAVMARETAVAFPHCGPLCAHVAGWLARAWRRVTVTR
ncbi:GNAT family N-acetyltransferase [Streptomyces sp. NPDC048415]|uniref:GNAT family N-acetyltransferase n=1 Tax=Streptomyces sp. NPDC048415 TaxID=3154822 RepID=UPI00341C9ACE